MRQPLFMSVVAAAFVTIAALPAVAADYDRPLIIENAPNLAPVEIGSGWYLRGDVGYNIRTRQEGDFTYRTFNAGTYSSHTPSSANLSDDFTFGIGVGYSFTDLLRADVTVTRLSSTYGGTGPCDPSLGPDCIMMGDAEFSAYAALANVYVDLGTFVGFTPYVGAGVGYTYLSWDDLQSHNRCAGVPCVGNSGTVHPGESDWRFTYALMAGMSYDISDNMKLDLGYRYLNVDDGDMFSWDAASSAAGAIGVQGQDPGFTAHEVRLGLRLELW